VQFFFVVVWAFERVHTRFLISHRRCRFQVILKEWVVASACSYCVITARVRIVSVALLCGTQNLRPLLQAIKYPQASTTVRQHKSTCRPPSFLPVRFSDRCMWILLPTHRQLTSFDIPLSPQTGARDKTNQGAIQYSSCLLLPTAVSLPIASNNGRKLRGRVDSTSDPAAPPA